MNFWSNLCYHCTGNKGKCPEPYAHEEVLEACFADLLKGLVFDDEVMDWIVDALHQSDADEKRFRRDAIARLQDEQSIGTRKKGVFPVQTAKFKRKAEVAEFRVFELDLEGSNSHRDISPTL